MSGLDGWIDWWMDGLMGGWRGECMKGCMSGLDGWTDVWKDGWTEARMDESIIAGRGVADHGGSNTNQSQLRRPLERHENRRIENHLGYVVARIDLP